MSKGLMLAERHRLIPNARAKWRGLGLFIVLSGTLTASCASSEKAREPNGTGGGFDAIGGATKGGASSTTVTGALGGHSSGTGGSTGGATSPTSKPSIGGGGTAGAAGSTGNASVGGSVSGGTGATDHATSGGAAGAGGATAVGGTRASGGYSSGVATTSSGGALPTGGTAGASGGAPTGGVASTGGAAQTGGVTGAGGAPTSGGSLATGGVVTTGGAASVGGSSNLTRPAGYYSASDWLAETPWYGCVWTGTDTIANTTTTIAPADFRSVPPGGPYNVKGIVNKSENAAAMLGFNVSEAIDGTTDQCWYNDSRMVSPGPVDMSMENIKLRSNGIAVAWTAKAKPTILQLQLQASDGYTNLDHVWCATVTDPMGPSFVKWTDFYTYCWDYPTSLDGHIATRYAGEPIDAIVFVAVGNGISDEFYDFTITGFAATVVSDAPGESAR